MESGPAKRLLAVAELLCWLVQAVGRLAVLVPGDRSARVLRPNCAGNHKPGSRRVPVRQGGRFWQPGPREHEPDRGNQNIIR